jgi:hypothetical protein
MNPTDTNGTLLNAPKIHLTLRRAANEVVTGNVKVLVRDPEAKSEKWYTADEKGGVDVELPSDPATVVAITNGRITTWTLASTCKNAGLTVDSRCIQVASPKPVTLQLNE